MRPNQVQNQAMYLLQRLKKQQEPEGGMVLYSAIVECQLDGTPESIYRLDKLFSQMTNKGITLQRILTKPNHKNFLLTIAVYLGDYIGNLINETPQWSSLDSMSVFTDDSEVDFEFSYSLGAQFSHGFVWPLAMVKAVFAQTTTFNDYITQTSDMLIAQDKVNLKSSPREIVNQYLKKVRTGKLIDNTMAYHHLLKHIDYDSSYQSLEQIDRILKLIKAYETLSIRDYERFIKDPERVNFIYFLGCYVAATSAKLAKTMPLWSDTRQSLPKSDNLSTGFEYNQAVKFGDGQLSFPLAAITNGLFDKDSSAIKGAKAFADDVLKNATSTLSSYPFLRNPITLSSSKYIPQEWKQAGILAGMLAANCIASICEGGSLSPTSIHIVNNEIGLFQLTHQELEQLLTAIDIPNLDSPYGLVGYHANVDLPTGCSDGIAVEIRVYGELKLSLQFILPYRQAQHELGFAIYPLVNQHYNCPKDSLPALAQAFYEGVKQVKDPINGTDFWASYYINKHDLFAPAHWMTKPITTFNPADSQIELLPVWE